MSEAGDCSVFPPFFPFEKWLRRLICYQNSCQIISWPSIINWFTAAALVKTPGPILAGPELLSCPVPPTERACPSSCHGAQGSDVNLGRLRLQWPSSVSWWVWHWKNRLVFAADWCGTLALLLRTRPVSSSSCSDQITSTNLCLHNFFHHRLLLSYMRFMSKPCVFFLFLFGCHSCPLNLNNPRLHIDIDSILLPGEHLHFISLGVSSNLCLVLSSLRSATARTFEIAGLCQFTKIKCLSSTKRPQRHSGLEQICWKIMESVTLFRLLWGLWV